MTDLPLIILSLTLIVLYYIERIPADLSSLIIIVLLALLGYLTPEKAISGFASPTVFTIISMYFITGALRRTGVANKIGTYIYRATGKSEILCISAVVLISCFVSSFMNNLAAALLLMPVVVSLSNKSNISSSRLLMPMSFGVIIGGLNTLIGTTTNILATDLMRSRGIEPFSFFEFTPFGLTFSCITIVFFVLLARNFLPNKSHSDDFKQSQLELTEVYRLEERLFTLGVPKDFPLSGKTLGELHFAEELGVTVDTIIRKEQRIEFPTASEQIYSEDQLVVQGRLDEFKAIQRLKDLNFNKEGKIAFDTRHPLFVGAVIEFKDNQIANKTFRELTIREKLQFEVVKIERAGKFITEELAELKILPGDKLHIITSPENLKRKKEESMFFVHKEATDISSFLPDMLHMFSIEEGSLFSGIAVKNSGLGKLARINILSIVRGREPIFGNLRDVILQKGDRVLVIAEKSHFTRIIELSKLVVLNKSNPRQEITLTGESNNMLVAEAVLSPRSWLIGRTLEEINFRDKYQCQVLAIWRKGEPNRTRIAKVKLEFGDTLLLMGDQRALTLLKKDTNFVLLFDSAVVAQRAEKGIFAVLSILLMVGLSIFAHIPVFMSAIISALFAVITGAIQMEEGYKDIDWKIITLVGTMIALGSALEHSVTLNQLSTTIADSLVTTPAIVTYFLLALLASVVCQLFDSTLGMVLIVPIAIATARNPEIDTRGALMAITLGASMLFMSPYSHRAHLLVMGVGGYKTSDFFKIGTVFTIILLSAIAGLVSFIY